MRRGGSALRLLLLLAVVCGCSGEGLRVTVVVNNQSGKALQSLLATPTIARAGVASAWPAEAVRGRLDRFVMTLSVLAPGTLTVSISGLDTEQCPLAAGTSAPLSVGLMGNYTTSVTLTALPMAQQGCHVVVTQTGDGTGTVTDSITNRACDPAGSCVVSAPLGESVGLQATAAEGSYFLGWSGACTGTAPCAVTSAAAPVGVSAGFLPRDVCTAVAGQPRWCWENPLPQGNGLGAVWARTATDAWAVGENGIILHWNGFFWAPVPSGTNVQLSGVWGTAADDVWVVGNAGTILHWNGAVFTAVPSNSSSVLTGVHGSGPKDVWVVGFSGTVLHSTDGASFQSMAINTTDGLGAVWAITPSDVWAVGGDTAGTILHFDGTAFTTVSNCAPGALSSVWIADNRIFAAGYNGDSTQGFIVQGNLPFQGDACAWETSVQDYPISSLWGSGPTDVWAVGAQHSILHFDGAAWSYASPPAADEVDINLLLGISGSGPDDLWMVGGGGDIEHWDGTAFASLLGGAATNAQIQALWANTATDVWAVGTQGTILHWDGSTWSHPSISLAPWTWRAVWGSGANDVWIVGEGGNAIYWDGSNFNSFSTSTIGIDSTFNAVWGSGPNDVWIAGQQGQLWHTDGKTASLTPNVTSDILLGLSGSGPTDIWAVGGVFEVTSNGVVTQPAHGTILHNTGSGWTVFSSGEPQVLDSVWSQGPGQVWAAGYGGTLLRLSTGTFVPVDLPPVLSGLYSAVIYDIWGSGPRDIWATGLGFSGPGPAGSSVLHFDGTTWSPSLVADLTVFIAVGGTSAGDVWTAGQNGAILHHHLQ